ncbi:hypothetical protein EDD86DRAFT_247435 [Gorgonomyces haynaldii]|nr:hypothetical protein EDD86DRAFT_247435 [Gorgonomyces haynaldii]
MSRCHIKLIDGAPGYPVFDASSPVPVSLLVFGIILLMLLLYAISATFAYIGSKHFRWQLTLHLTLGIVLTGTLLVTSYLDLPNPWLIRHILNVLLSLFLALIANDSIKFVETMPTLFPELNIKTRQRGQLILGLLHIILMGPSYYELFMRDIGTGLFVILMLVFNQYVTMTAIKRLMKMRSVLRHIAQQDEQVYNPTQDTRILKLARLSMAGCIIDALGFLVLVAHLMSPDNNDELMCIAAQYYVFACLIMGCRLPVSVISIVTIQFISFPEKMAQSPRLRKAEKVVGRSRQSRNKSQSFDVLHTDK